MTAPTYTRIRTMARNSASRSIQTPDAVANANTRKSAECTGLRVVITRIAANTSSAANR